MGATQTSTLRRQYFVEIILVLSIKLDFAKGEYSFKSGSATFGWQRQDGAILAYITLPVGVKGRISYGNIDCELKTGYNEFALQKSGEA